MISSKTAYIFFNLVSIWLIIDAINGFCLTTGIDIPLSPIYKITIMLIVTLGLTFYKKGIVTILNIYIYIGILFLHLILNIRMPMIGETMNHLFRFILIILIYSYAKILIQKNSQYVYHRISKIFNINTCVLIINILVGLFGLGYSAYVEGLGYRGFFYAGNELSGLIIVLFPFLLYKVGEKYSYHNIRYLSTVFLCLITATLLGTKTGLLAVIISIIIIPNLTISRKKAFKIVPIILLGTMTIIYALYLALDSLGMVERWTYFYEQGGLSQLLLSGRHEFWLAEKDKFFEAPNILIRFLGLGFSNNKSIEMDPLDTLLYYGYIGIIITYTFYFYLLIKSYQYCAKNKIARLIFFINILLLSASTFAGHILYSGMASLFIALINTLIYIPNNIITTSTKHEESQNSCYL